jgi:tRNA-Thr(GGU) m(6)t(6)A37 methyltransferase TsaA
MTARPQDIDAAPAKEHPVIEDPDLLPVLGGMRPVAVVHSPFRNHFDTPRQPGVGEAPADGWIELRRGLQNTVRDLKGFDYCWVLFWFNYSRGWKDTVVPPRDGQHRGLFATRSPHRPNPIGLSCVRLLNVQGRKLLIRDHDLLHGTPVLDIKPYIPQYDARPDAKAGWVDELTEPGPDHRWQ